MVIKTKNLIAAIAAASVIGGATGALGASNQGGEFPIVHENKVSSVDNSAGWSPMNADEMNRFAEEHNLKSTDYASIPPEKFDYFERNALEIGTNPYGTPMENAGNYAMNGFFELTTGAVDAFGNPKSEGAVGSLVRMPLHLINGEFKDTITAIPRALGSLVNTILYFLGSGVNLVDGTADIAMGPIYDGEISKTFNKGYAPFMNGGDGLVGVVKGESENPIKDTVYGTGKLAGMILTGNAVGSAFAGGDAAAGTSGVSGASSGASSGYSTAGIFVGL